MACSNAWEDQTIWDDFSPMATWQLTTCDAFVRENVHITEPNPVAGFFDDAVSASILAIASPAVPFVNNWDTVEVDLDDTWVEDTEPGNHPGDF